MVKGVLAHVKEEDSGLEFLSACFGESILDVTAATLASAALYLFCIV
jgi:hypothetical protein